MPLLECFSGENTRKELEYQILCPSGFCLEHGRVVGSEVRGTPQSPCFAGARTIPQRGLRCGAGRRASSSTEWKTSILTGEKTP